MDFKDILKNRRAVNFFDPDKDVSENQLRSLVEMAAQTPSGFNLQPWSLMVLRTPDDKMRLRKLAWDQAKITEAPIVLIVLADRDGWKEGHPFVEKNFQEMIRSGAMTEEQRQWFAESREALYGASGEKSQAFACKNTGFFAMSLMFAAKELGLDTHPMDGFDHDAVRSAFNIPENYWIPLLLAVGYFKTDATLHPPKWRKRYEDIVVTFD